MSYERSCNRNRCLLKLYNKTKYKYIGVYYDRDKNRYIKSKRPNLSKWHKKQSNRKLRRNKNLNYKNSQYKKLYDFWWELI